MTTFETAITAARLRVDEFGPKIADIWHICAHGWHYFLCCVPGEGALDAVFVVRLNDTLDGLDTSANLWWGYGTGGRGNIVPNDAFLVPTKEGVGIGLCVYDGAPRLCWAEARADDLSDQIQPFGDLSEYMNVSGSGIALDGGGEVTIVAPDSYNETGSPSLSFLNIVTLQTGAGHMLRKGPTSVLYQDPSYSVLMPTYVADRPKPLLLVKLCRSSTPKDDSGRIVLYVEEAAGLREAAEITPKGNRPHLSWSEADKKVYVAFIDQSGSTTGNGQVRLWSATYAELGIETLKGPLLAVAAASVNPWDGPGDALGFNTPKARTTFPGIPPKDPTDMLVAPNWKVIPPHASPWSRDLMLHLGSWRPSQPRLTSTIHRWRPQLYLMEARQSWPRQT